MGQSNSIDQDHSAMESASQDPGKKMNGGHPNNDNGENAAKPAKPSQNDIPSTSTREYPETRMNLSLLDPPRWGWTAVGGVADVLTPHEVRYFHEDEMFFEFFFRCLTASSSPATFLPVYSSRRDHGDEVPHCRSRKNINDVDVSLALLLEDLFRISVQTV